MKPRGFLTILALCAVFIIIDFLIPRQHLPWRSLDPQAPLGMATKTQLLRLSLSPSSHCMDMAQNLEGFYSNIADPHDNHDICGWTRARDVIGSEFALLSGQASPMQCPLSVGSYLWMREVDQSAQVHLGSGVKSILHAGTYSCRRQVGNSSNAWSEHAFANAWDVMGFELDNGEKITVLKDWNGLPEKQKFLRQVRSKACQIFRVTLSPDFNAAHRDHFHLDMGPTRSCR